MKMGASFQFSQFRVDRFHLFFFFFFFKKKMVTVNSKEMRQDLPIILREPIFYPGP